MKQYYIIDPQTYDDQFWWKKDDIEFWKSILVADDVTILELAAGTGRLGMPLVREGVQYTGLELSTEYVKYGNLKFPSPGPIIEGDIRNFKLLKTYDFIFIGFNSFLHLLSEKDVVKCLNSIKKHMHSKTRLYIDIFIPDDSFLRRSPSSDMTVMEFFDSKNHCTSTIKEKLVYDRLNEIASVSWQYRDDKNICYRQFDFQMKVYYPDTMNKLFANNGFYVYELWGSYNKSPLKETSPLQIYELGI